MDKVIFALENFKNIQELIKFIDQKAGAILVLYGFIIAAFIEFTNRLFLVNPFEIGDYKKSLISIMTFVSGLALVLILLYQLYSILFDIIKPRLAKNYSKNEYSLFYFEHIAHIDKKVIIADYENITEERMLAEVIGQVYEVSKIMKKKVKKLAQIVKFFFLSIILLLIFIFFSSLLFS